MSGWSGGGPGGSDPRSEGWDPQRPSGTDPWGRPVQTGQGAQPGWGSPPGPPGAPSGQSTGWQTQSAPSGLPGTGQPSGWQTQTGSQPVYRAAPPPPPGWGPPPGQQPPPGWGQQPPPGQPPGYPRQPSQGAVPPGWNQPQPGWGQPQSQAPIPTWAQPPQGAVPPVWARTQAGQASPPATWGQPPAGPSSVAPAWGVTAAGPDPDAFPVRLMFDETQGIGRLWGLPLIGFAVRMLLLIPHLIVLMFLAVAAVFLMYLSWIPVLFTGRQAGFVVSIVGGYLRWSTRLTAYLYLLTSGYPPFSLLGEDDYRVRVEIDEDQRINRLWGIPLIGFLVRVIILIPHFIVLWLIGIAAFVLIAFSWLPVLLLGRQAQLVYSVVGGWMRYGLRVTSYLMLLHDRYPPFSLGNEEADRYRTA